MATIVNIIIKGVAICYKKNQADGRTFRWRVLFPFDDNTVSKKCHIINYSSRKGGGIDSPNVSLSVPQGEINITVPGYTGSLAGSEAESFSFVLDLTNTDTSTGKPETHNAVKLITEGSKPKWREGTVIMKIDAPALFSADTFLPPRDIHGDKPQLGHFEDAGTIGAPRDLDIIAHDIKAVIELPDGEAVKLTTSTGVNESFSNGVFTLTFDNDCNDQRPGKNDMDMFYDNTIVDRTNPKIRFLVGGRPPVNILETASGLRETNPPSAKKRRGAVNASMAPPSTPPNFAGGKPCLSVKVSKADELVDDPSTLP